VIFEHKTCSKSTKRDPRITFCDFGITFCAFWDHVLCSMNTKCGHEVGKFWITFCVQKTQNVVRPRMITKRVPCYHILCSVTTLCGCTEHILWFCDHVLCFQTTFRALVITNCGQRPRHVSLSAICSLNVIQRLPIDRKTCFLNTKRDQSPQHVIRRTTFCDFGTTKRDRSDHVLWSVNTKRGRRITSCGPIVTLGSQNVPSTKRVR